MRKAGGIALILLGVAVIYGTLWMSVDAARYALAQPDSEWGRSTAQISWMYCGLFAWCSLFGVCFCGMGAAELKGEL